MIQNQLFSFFIYIIVGILLGFIFDIFRAFRKSVKNTNLATNIEDILFVIISFIIIAMVVQIVSKGELRFYILLGIILGILLYFLSVSKYIITGETWILKNIIKILKSIYIFFIKFFKKINDLILKFLNKVKHK
jgi:spore cortex biosynthesis protein YabQ